MKGQNESLKVSSLPSLHFFLLFSCMGFLQLVVITFFSMFEKKKTTSMRRPLLLWFCCKQEEGDDISYRHLFLW
jgi:hypothetical protein